MWPIFPNLAHLLRSKLKPLLMMNESLVLPVMGLLKSRSRIEALKITAVV